MAKLTKEDVLKLAGLSRLHVSDEEIEQLQVEIQTILSYVEQLQKIDLGDLKPTDQVTGLENVMRKDEVIDYGATPEMLLKNAPAVVDNLLKVRRVL